jgi:hypothetical protein
MDDADRPKVLLVCSSGGHLAQLMALESWWSSLRRTWVTFDKVDAISILKGEDVVWAYHPTTRNIPNLIRNLFLAVRTIRRLRPDIIISSGAAVSFPFFLVGKLFRIPTCFIEVYDYIEHRTLSGRLCRPISDLFLVQWEEQLELYPKAQLIGRLL